MLVLPIVGTTSPFTGRGFVTIGSGSSLEFILMVPEDSQYELILRYEVGCSWFVYGVEPKVSNQLLIVTLLQTGNVTDRERYSETFQYRPRPSNL